MSTQKDVQCCEVIVTNQLTRGNGQPHDPIRRIVQVFTKDGELIAEKDPHTFVAGDLAAFARWYNINGKATPDARDVGTWLQEIEKETSPNP